MTASTGLLSFYDLVAAKLPDSTPLAARLSHARAPGCQGAAQPAQAVLRLGSLRWVGLGGKVAGLRGELLAASQVAYTTLCTADAWSARCLAGPFAKGNHTPPFYLSFCWWLQGPVSASARLFRSCISKEKHIFPATDSPGLLNGVTFHIV